MSEKLKKLEKTIGYHFKSEELLRLALTHPSSSNAPNSIENNQRLEFLGDAVIGLIMAGELFNAFPEKDEGFLSNARSKFINGRVLACCARKINLGEYLIISQAEENAGLRERDSSLSDAFEALIGAIYLDRGLRHARRLLLECFGKLELEIKEQYLDNPKGHLQEILQATSQEPPKYKVIKTSGPDHARVFECAVMHQGKILGTGAGGSKKAAETNAAIAALELLKNNGEERAKKALDFSEKNFIEKIKKSVK
ncbi:MAG: ribonuclease III [Verrucomicrobiae bacterium]|nr:ribonuclease III [Verrucomicrobiae bacterium]